MAKQNYLYALNIKRNILSMVEYTSCKKGYLMKIVTCGHSIVNMLEKIAWDIPNTNSTLPIVD